MRAGHPGTPPLVAAAVARTGDAGRRLDAALTGVPGSRISGSIEFGRPMRTSSSGEQQLAQLLQTIQYWEAGNDSRENRTGKQPGARRGGPFSLYQRLPLQVAVRASNDTSAHGFQYCFSSL